MKDKLTSFLQTAFKGLGGAGGYLAGKGLIDAGDIGIIDASGQSLALAMATIIGAVLAHLSGQLIARYLPGFLGNGGSGRSPLFLVTTAVGFSMAGSLLSSCSSLGSAITGAPIPATAVQRAGHADATPVLISSADLAQAEAGAEAAAKAGQDAPVHGLYDAGKAAAAIREVFTESGK